MENQTKKLRLENIKVMSFVTALEKDSAVQTPLVGRGTDGTFQCTGAGSSECQSISMLCPRSGCTPCGKLDEEG